MLAEVNDRVMIENRIQERAENPAFMSWETQWAV
jgi:hypothetical protein